MIALLAAVVLTASLATLLAPVLPVLVDVVARSTASARFKSLLLGVLSAVVVLFDRLVFGADGSAVISDALLVDLVMTWAVALLTFFGVLKPTGLSDNVQNRTAAIGIGPSRSREIPK